MLESYFFIPSDKKKFIDNAKNLQADYFVFDLEDSVSKKNKMDALHNLNYLIIEENHFVRIPLFDNDYSKEQLIELINIFKGRVIIPKVKNKSQIQWLTKLHTWDFKLKLILLIECPICFYNIPDILKNYKSHVKAIGFGTHDFCAAMGMKHNNEQIYPYKKQLLLISKVYNVDYIDGVDINITDSSHFIKETIYAIEAGADGKFIIHPNHLDALNNLEVYTKDEIDRMKYVYNQYLNIGNDDMDIFTLDGIVYEKPHILKIEKALNKLNKKTT